MHSALCYIARMPVLIGIAAALIVLIAGGTFILTIIDVMKRRKLEAAALRVVPSNKGETVVLRGKASASEALTLHATSDAVIWSNLIGQEVARRPVECVNSKRGVPFTLQLENGSIEVLAFSGPALYAKSMDVPKTHPSLRDYDQLFRWAQAPRQFAEFWIPDGANVIVEGWVDGSGAFVPSMLADVEGSASDRRSALVAFVITLVGIAGLLYVSIQTAGH